MPHKAHKIKSDFRKGKLVLTAYRPAARGRKAIHGQVTMSMDSLRVGKLTPETIDELIRGAPKRK